MRLLATVLAVTLSSSLFPAEVRLRESLLNTQRNRATITVTAVVDHSYAANLSKVWVHLRYPQDGQRA